MQHPSAVSPRTLGEVIRAARETLNYSKKELAERCQLSAGYISQIEKNERVPSVPVCQALAQALQFDVKRLYILAFRQSTPIEIQQAVEGMPGTSEVIEEDRELGQIDAEFMLLFEGIKHVPTQSRKQVLRAWAETLKLITDKA